MSSIQHPASIPARLARRFRFLRHVRGWQRLVNTLVSPGLSGTFVIENDGMAFAGELASYIDRQMYLFGQYEEQAIQLFLGVVPPGRRRLIMDVGGNVGTHSLGFARFFRRVETFEPNPALWAAFERNMALNSFSHVTLHKVGLGDAEAELPFYSIDKSNFGLGTFSTEQQYDLPLHKIAVCRVATGDAYVAEQGITDIDAIKIDVQGFEPMVLRGCQGILARHRPVVWFEYGAGTRANVRTAGDLQALFPYPVALLRVVPQARLFTWTTNLQPETGDLPTGDYFVVPR
ncbi:MAG: FkbM family methyltransferase [Gammaproteobacteria bacterium]